MTDNAIQTFLLEASGIRGRVVRMGDVLDELIGLHKTYPPSLSQLTAEAITITTLLSSMLKFDGVFSLQAQGDGPVSMVVADMVSNGDLRACATIREGKEDKIPANDSTLTSLLGQGYLAFTVDQGVAAERYQGIVELRSEGLLASVQHYFHQSEQITTGLKVAVGLRGGRWRAGGILVQGIPEEGGHDAASYDEDDWRRTMLLLETTTDDELTNPALDAETLLYRLFNEEDVRVFEPSPLRQKCRCSQDRLRGILSTMPPDDIKHMVKDRKITMTCQFCSTDYVFNPAEFSHLRPV